MIKKIVAGSLFTLGLVMGVVGVVHAWDPTFDSQTKSVLNPVDLLGVNVLGGDMVFKFVDMSTSTDEMEYRLPPLSTSGIDGDIYMLKAIGGNYLLHVYPDDGNYFDMGSNDRILSNSGSVILLADVPNNTWWVIGYSQY